MTVPRVACTTTTNSRTSDLIALVRPWTGQLSRCRPVHENTPNAAGGEISLLAEGATYRRIDDACEERWCGGMATVAHPVDW